MQWRGPAPAHSFQLGSLPSRHGMNMYMHCKSKIYGLALDTLSSLNVISGSRRLGYNHAQHFMRNYSINTNGYANQVADGW
ncbi:hypothetical protein PAXRUDRAFT_498291 [Paxillus rubicundulus Ve08.2h10]|uniref:Uncharacterized protein n=1 Tax=Paxillus rubicundulus Ve08.2h10 TaxID=930991 RepID=A0A0D0ECL2_9AGAM|nr:hypothetical protein PAXRUDRAFT_498291 [Paxillus rubicundulus Ve08.2h10]